MELSWIGLALIIVGWLIQFSALKKKRNEISPSFIMVYSLGVALLVVDGYRSGSNELAFLNLLSLFSAVIVLFGVKEK